MDDRVERSWFGLCEAQYRVEVADESAHLLVAAQVALLQSEHRDGVLSEDGEVAKAAADQELEA